MTPEQINIKIAEACGWTNLKEFIRHKDEWLDPKTPEVAIIGHPPEVGSCSVPNYCADLNAMHEAEKILTPDQEEVYVHCLADLVVNDDRWDKSYLCSGDQNYRATARQRAEAFLRALNKWEEAA